MEIIHGYAVDRRKVLFFKEDLVFVDKNYSKIAKQGAGAPDLTFYGDNANLAIVFQELAKQSIINCGKHLVGGGYNPR